MIDITFSKVTAENRLLRIITIDGKAVLFINTTPTSSEGISAKLNVEEMNELIKALQLVVQQVS